MSSELVNRLMNAEDLKAFMREHGPSAGREVFAALKSEVDHLAGRDLAAASRLADRINQLAAVENNPVSTAFARAGRARVLHLSGRHTEANNLFESAVDALLAARLRTQAAIFQKQQVDALTQMGRYKDALRLARTARRALAKNEPVHLAQLETHVGNIYYRLDRYKKALAHYDTAREILESKDEATMCALVDGNRSNIFAEMDRPLEAMALLEQAASVLEDAGQTLLAAQARSKIAYLQFLRGNYNAALAGYYNVREQLAGFGSQWLVAWCNLEIAEILLALNSFDDASEHAALAHDQFSQIGTPYESAQALVVRALAAMGLAQLDQAGLFLESAREVFAANRNNTFAATVDTYLSELSLRRGDHTEAAARAGAALRVFSRQKLPGRAAYSRLLGARAAYLAGDSKKAARKARAALGRATAQLVPSVTYQCHHLIGKIERDRGQIRAALERFQIAVRTVEQMRGGIAADEFKATFLRDKIGVYEDAIGACLDQSTEPLVEEAFRLVESSKSRALADLLARYLRDPQSTARRPVEDEARTRLLTLIENLNWYSSQARLEDEKGNQRRAHVAGRYARQVEHCERRIAELFRRMEADGSQFAEMQRMQAASVSDLRSSLEADETAIEYFTTGNVVSAFIVGRDCIRVVREVASKGEVEKMLAGLRFQLEKFNYGSEFADEHFEHLNHATNQHLIRLSEAVFAPLEPYIEGDRLIIIPHGALHYVPFHALLDRRGFLIDRFEISYAPSATVLKLCRDRGNQISADARASSNLESQISNLKCDMVALGVAHPETPSIEAEVSALRKIFPGAVTLVGDDATRDNLMKHAPRARFLHLASHGYFRRDNPMFSFLKLADSPLNFYSLLELELKAEMVTLSACHTGVNMVFPGDELHGLVRGFLYAGAPSLVASLWAANDTATAEFMQEMYGHLREGATKRAALRAAQLALKDMYGHPYYWAPFVLMGNPN